MDYDVLLEKCPELRKWQLGVVAVLWLPALSGGLNIMSYTFASYTPPHRCLVEGCETNLSSQGDPSKHNWFRDIMEDVETDSSRQIDEQCDFFTRESKFEDSDFCSSDLFNLNKTYKCDDYVYDRSIFENTLVTDYNLVCSEKWKKRVLGLMYMGGLFLGSYIIGFLSDRYGRKLAMVGSLLLLAVAGGAAGLAPNYPVYAVCYIMASIAGYGTYVAPFLLTVEMMGKNEKTTASLMINFPFVIGEALMCLIAWATRDYRLMHLAAYLPLLALLGFWFVLPESPRWLLAKGRVEEAKEVVKRGARLVGVKIPEELLGENSSIKESSSLMKIGDHVPQEKQQVKEVLFMDMFKSRVLLPRILATYVNWMVINLCYYGLTMNSVNLAGDVFLNTLLGVLIEAPGYLIAILTMDRFGRKPILTICQLVSGVACIGAGFVPADLPVLMTVLSCVGKMGTSAAFALIYLYSAEMFPTSVRNTALGTCSMVARIGGFMAPYIASLGSADSGSTFIPFLVFGVSTLLGGSTALILPETLGTQLPDTVQDAEKLITEPSTRDKKCGCC